MNKKSIHTISLFFKLNWSSGLTPNFEFTQFSGIETDLFPDFQTFILIIIDQNTRRRHPPPGITIVKCIWSHLWENISILSPTEYTYIFHCRSEVGVGTPSPDEPGHKKTPEMNELETD